MKRNKEINTATLLWGGKIPTFPYIVFSIIVVIVIIGIICSIISPEQFTIYKNECRNIPNDTFIGNFILNTEIEGDSWHNISLSYKISGLKMYSSPEGSKYLKCNEQEGIGNVCAIMLKGRNTTLCEQKEVQRMNLSDAWDICWKYDIDENVFVTCSSLLYEELTLTTSWLDENCECSEWKTRKGDIINYEDYKASIKSFPKDYKCSKYSCGDYLVGVKNG